MLWGGGEDQEWFLLHGDLHIIGICSFKVIDLWLPEDESFGLDCLFLESDPSGHIFDMLHDEVNWDSIIPEARDNDIGIDDGGVDEVSEGIFDKFIVLFQDTDDRSPSFSSISLQSSTKPDIIWIIGPLPSQLMKIL